MRKQQMAATNASPSARFTRYNPDAPPTNKNSQSLRAFPSPVKVAEAASKQKVTNTKLSGSLIKLEPKRMT